MHYLTTYYKNLSEQLQAKLNLLEAKLNTPAEIANSRTNILSPMERSQRAGKREDMISSLINTLRDPATKYDVDHGAVERVLRDAIKIPEDQSGASSEDLKHVMAYLRKDYYDVSNPTPEEQKLNAARQKTYEKHRNQ